MRLAATITIIALASLVLAGCGSGGDGTATDSTQGHTGAPIGASARACESQAVDAEALRATGISCDRARQVMYGWQRERSCSAPAGASRSSCRTRSYRCLSTRTDRGVAVSCARTGESVAFLAKRD
jgi:hypothetical protein